MNASDTYILVLSLTFDAKLTQETARLLAAADTTTAQLSALSVAPLAAGLGSWGAGHGEAALRSTVAQQGALISDYRMEVSG